ncbi:MAG: metalloregulator ArsR/SmtB family transcription factor [Syntrophorhabdaceae bacterium]|nr:metalloregulator ArsR/SmtB family transcription factor [Syntrophorhabdaceae bacterium]
MNNEKDKNLYELQANVCLAMANPKRLQILNLLKDGEMSVSEIIRITELPKANVSQHLSILKQHGIVSYRREGTSVFYRIANPKISEACAIMREVLVESLKTKETLSKMIRGEKEEDLEI